MINPTAAHFEEAKLHTKLAAEHRAASRALQDAESRARLGIDPSDREISPFHHGADIAAVNPLGTPGAETGIEVTFKPVVGLTVENLQHLIDCHLARSAALGHQVPEMPYSPLVPNACGLWAAEGSVWRRPAARAVLSNSLMRALLLSAVLAVTVAAFPACSGNDDHARVAPDAAVVDGDADADAGDEAKGVAEADAADDAGACLRVCPPSQLCCLDAHGHNPTCVSGVTCP